MNLLKSVVKELRGSSSYRRNELRALMKEFTILALFVLHFMIDVLVDDIQTESLPKRMLLIIDEIVVLFVLVWHV